MKRIRTHGTCLAGLLASVACQQAPGEVAVGTTQRAIEPCDPVNVDLSLVVHDQATIGAADFSFARTIGAIRNSSGGAATTDQALVQTLLAGLSPSQFPQPVSGLPIPTDTRAEANLSATDMLGVTNAPADMRPIALFNRFDLAPADGSHCGEYRIVYGRYPNNGTDRFLLIFEAVLPNPNPSQGLEGCRPVANFWHSLSEPTLTPAQRATMLADFYFVGLPGFSPVVAHANYGVPLGQVRSNMFRPGQPVPQVWMLREWRTSFNGSGQAVFVVDTDKDNPLVEFYDETSVNPNPALFATEQGAFQNDFTTNRLALLAAPELGGTATSQCNVVNGFGAQFPLRFNEFQSNAGGFAASNDEPRIEASTNFRNAVQTAAAAQSIPLTVNQLLNRAGTITCAGCHQLSNGEDLGSGFTWPNSAGFVHVSELGANPPAIAALSQALTLCFLPARRAILETFVCDVPQPDAGIADTGATDSGAVLDAGAPDSGVVACGPYQSCSPYEYCEFGSYNICGSNGSGVCTPRPAVCSPYGTQVCGCNGVTYASDCHAAQAGVDVASQGPCGGTVCNQRPPRGCCFEDSQCGTWRLKGGRCVGEVCGSQAGVCKGSVPKGSCWEDSDCGGGEECVGEQICPCGFACLVADQPGQCRARIIRTAVQQVSDARSSLLSATDSVSAAQSLSELEDAVQAAREEEAARPGAFHRVRRTH